MSKKKAKRNKKRAPKKTRAERIREKLAKFRAVVTNKAKAARGYAWAVLALCAILLLVNVGIPAINEKQVYDERGLSSYLVDPYELRTVTNGEAGWLAFVDWKSVFVGEYDVSVYYSTDTDDNYMEILTKDFDSIYTSQLSANETVHRVHVSIDIEDPYNFLLRVWYGGAGTLTVDRVVLRSDRKDLATVQCVLDTAVLFAILGYCTSKLKKVTGETELLPWKKRVIKALPVALLLAVTFCVTGPISLYVTNKSEFWFSLGQMAPMVLVCFAAVTILCTVLLSLVPKKQFYWVLAAVFGLGAALYAEGNFLVRDLGLIDGSDVEWNKFDTWAGIDTLIVLAIILIPILLMYFRRGFGKKVITFGSLFLVFTQLLATGMSVVTAGELDGDGNSILTTAHMTELSKEDNIFILMADSVDAEFLRSLLEDEPEYADKLEDFVWYRNASSSGYYTWVSVPSVFTGVTWKGEIDHDKMLKLADQYTPLYKALTDRGYDVGMYTDTLYVQPDQYMSNAYMDRPFISSQTKFASTWMKLTAFRYLPQIFKSLFEIGFAEFNEVKTGPNDTENYTLDKYSVNYLHRPIFADSSKKVFHFYHFFGAHFGAYLNEFGEVETDVTIDTTVRQRTKGSFKILFDYLDQMKELGVYDNSTIIFMADHGDSYSPLNPMFLIKPKGYSGAFSISDAPISYEDLLPTFLSLIGEDGSKYGRTIFEIGEDEQRQRECWGWWSREADAVECSTKYDGGTAPAWDFGAWTAEGSLQYALQMPIQVADLTEMIEDVERYNTIEVSNINEVRCDFTSPPAGDVQVNMTLYTLINDPSHLVVTANGEEVFNDSFVGGERSFTIPDELVDDSVTLRFTFPEAADNAAYLIAYDFAGTDMGA